MAGKLGSLTIDIAADVARLRRDMSRAQQSVGKATDNMARSARRAGRVIGAIGAGFVTRSIVRATTEQEAAVKQLEQGLASTGGIVGQSLDQLTKKAAALQAATTFGDEEIIKAQSQLVTFTKITGDEFDKTIELAADLSVRFGTDLKSSVLQLGKALNDPVKNLSALSRAGIQFSKQQTDQIKVLVASGKQVEAQRIILKELETQFGGSARAARDTFGGALDALRNSMGDLLEADGGLTGAKDSIEELNTLLSDPAFVQNTQALAAAMITAFAGVSKAIAGTVGMVRFLGEELAAKINGPALDDLVRVDEKLQKLAQTRQRIINIRDSQNNHPRQRARLNENIASIDAEIAALERGSQAFRKMQEDRARIPPALPPTTAPAASPASPASPAVTAVAVPTPSSDAKAIFNQTRTAAEKYAQQVKTLRAELDASNISQDTYNRAIQQYKETLAAADPALTAFNEQQAEAARIFEATRTPLENLQAEYAHLNDLLTAGVLTQDTYNRAVASAGEGFDALNENANKALTETNVFADQAARNMQNTFANFLFDPFDDGLKGMVAGFLNAIRRMVAEAAAAKIFEAIGGGGGGSDSAGGGALSSFLTSFLTGAASAEGGGYTASAPRVGGLDGRGGMLAVLHPNESVIDHTRGQSAGGVNIVQNFNGISGEFGLQKTARASSQELQRTING